MKYGSFLVKTKAFLLKLEVGNAMKGYKRKEIKTREDFVSFLNNLRKDYLDNISSWENRDIETYLEAMASWVEDMDGFYTNQGLPIPQDPSWKVFADILMGGKVYE